MACRRCRPLGVKWAAMWLIARARREPNARLQAHTPHEVPVLLFYFFDPPSRLMTAPKLDEGLGVASHLPMDLRGARALVPEAFLSPIGRTLFGVRHALGVSPPALHRARSPALKSFETRVWLVVPSGRTLT